MLTGCTFSDENEKHGTLPLCLRHLGGTKKTRNRIPGIETRISFLENEGDSRNLNSKLSLNRPSFKPIFIMLIWTDEGYFRFFIIVNIYSIGIGRQPKISEKHFMDGKAVSFI